MLSLSFFRASRSASSSDTGSATAQKSRSRTSEAGQTLFGKRSAESGLNGNCYPLAASQLPETKRMVVLTATKNLLSSHRFCIIDLRNIAQLVGVPTDGPAWDLLRPLHCVHYKDMPPQLRDVIPHLVNECLSASERVNADVITALKGVDL